jgi:hypothetical protein
MVRSYVPELVGERLGRSCGFDIVSTRTVRDP